MVWLKPMPLLLTDRWKAPRGAQVWNVLNTYWRGSSKNRDQQTDKQRDRETNRQTHRWTDRQTDRQTNRKTKGYIIEIDLYRLIYTFDTCSLFSIISIYKCTHLITICSIPSNLLSQRVQWQMINPIIYLLPFQDRHKFVTCSVLSVISK